MIGPGDLMRRPGDVANGILRAVDEVVRIRRMLEEALDWLHGDLEYLKGEVSYLRKRLDDMDGWLQPDVNQLKEEFATVREQVDELTNTLPTASRGPIEKVKDALTPESGDD